MDFPAPHEFVNDAILAYINIERKCKFAALSEIGISVLNIREDKMNNPNRKVLIGFNTLNCDTLSLIKTVRKFASQTDYWARLYGIATTIVGMVAQQQQFKFRLPKYKEYPHLHKSRYEMWFRIKGIDSGKFIFRKSITLLLAP